MSAGSHARSSLLNFFIYNTDYGDREGTEEEKIMLYVPQEESIDNKIKGIGLCQALVQFAETFSPSHPCECLITQKTKQYFYNPEGNFWLVMTLSIPYNEKTVKDKKVTEYFSDDIQDSIGEAVIRQAYQMFILFNGAFLYILQRYGLPALKERFQFFYTRYLQTLNFGQLDLLDVYQGVLYLPLDKSDFLKVQCFSNLIENTFKSVRHICILHNDHLLWTTLNRNNMKILYKYLTTSLLPASSEADSDVNLKSSPNSSSRNSPVGYINATFPNPGKFLTAPIEVINSSNGVPKRSPRVFITVENKICELHLLVYKAYNSIICLMLDLQTLTTDFCSKLHNFVGPQLGNLSSIITEQASKRSIISTDQQYRFVYFNEMNLAIKSSIHAKRSTTLVSVSPDIMRILVDIHSDLEKSKSGGEIVTKTLADCWIVGKKSGCREFFVILNQKNATLVEINEEVQRLMMTSFNNILFLE